MRSRENSDAWLVEIHTLQSTRYWVAWYNRALTFFFFRPTEPTQTSVLRYLTLERDRYMQRHMEIDEMLKGETE